MHGHDLRARLGPDLAALARARDVVRCEEVTRLASATRQRGAFVLELADGTRLKGRRFESVERAQEVQALRARLGDLVPPLLAVAGDAFVLPWVAGETLDALPSSAALLRRCGELLGALHARHAEPGPPTAAPIAALAAKLEASVATLVDLGLLSTDMARCCLVEGLRARPEVGAMGLILRDFSPDNLVLRPDGALVYIDEANLTLGPIDHDLARTWLRWPMSADERASFIAGYEVHRSSAAFTRHLRFWATLALTSAAVLRARLQVSGAHDYLARLGPVLDHDLATRVFA